MFEQHTRKLSRTSQHSYCVVIPKEIILKYDWKEGQKMVVEDKGRGKIEVRQQRGR